MYEMCAIAMVGTYLSVQNNALKVAQTLSIYVVVVFVWP